MNQSTTNFYRKGGRTAAQGRSARNVTGGVFSAGKDQQEQIVSMRQENDLDVVVMPELNLDEIMRVRTVFFNFVREEYVNTKFDLRVLLSELGLYPTDEEMTFVLSSFDNKMSFTNFCHYLRFYKREFQVSAQRRHLECTGTPAEEEIEDTLRAFVSLGGNEDGSGCVSLEDLRQICRNFGLTIDIDAMLSGIVDIESQTTLNYTEFCDMWRVKRQRNGCSSIASAASQLDVLSSILAIGNDRLTAVRSNGAKSESGVNGVGRFTLVREEKNVEGYRFPQSSETGGFTSAQQQGEFNAFLQSGEEHMRALKRFLCSENTSGGGFSPHTSVERRRMGRHPSVLLTLQTAALEGEWRRSDLLTREEAGAAGAVGTAGGSTNNDGVYRVSAGGGFASGGYQAPSPLILSLRNSNAYKRRLQTFVRKMNTRSKSRKSISWSRNQSIVPDDDSGRT